MGLNKDNNGIAPFLALIAIIVVGSVAVGGTYMVLDQLTERPDVTYNIIESPFTFLGSSVSWIWIILIGVFIVFILLWIFTRTKKKPERITQYTPYRRD